MRMTAGAESESKAVTRIGETVIDFGIFAVAVAAARPLLVSKSIRICFSDDIEPFIPDFTLSSVCRPEPHARESAAWNKISDPSSAPPSER